jgi:hypothetical protein
VIVVALSSSKVPFFGGVVLQAAHHVLMGNILPTPLSAFAMKQHHHHHPKSFQWELSWEFALQLW